MNQTEPPDSPTIVLRKLHRWRMAFFGLVILVAGVVIGAGSMLIFVRHQPMGGPAVQEFTGKRMIRGLQRDLDLSPEQVEKIEPILRERMQKLHEIRRKARPQIAEQLRLMNEEVSSLLDEHQKDLWQQHLARLQRKLRPGPRRRRGGRRRHHLGPEERFGRSQEPFDRPPPAERHSSSWEPNKSQDIQER